MKIPDSVNNGYYVNDENGQVPWQNNSVIMDGVVTNMGGVVGGGDAGYIPPMYTVPRSMPSGPGYMMNNPYMPVSDEDFSEFMWMENMDEFDKQYLQHLEEEEIMQESYQSMLDDERRSHNPNGKQTNNGISSLAEAVSRSTLNPLAAEFVPTRSSLIPDRQNEPPLPKAPMATNDGDSKVMSEECRERIEGDASAAQTTQPAPAEYRPDERPSAVNCDLKQTKSEPITNCTDGKANKKSTKVSKSDVKVSKAETLPPQLEVKSEEQSIVQPQHSIEPQSSAAQPQAAMKPINYAAAARANKPKKSTPPPQPIPLATEAKTSEVKVQAQVVVTTTKGPSRKNSAAK